MCACVGGYVLEGDGRHCAPAESWREGGYMLYDQGQYIGLKSLGDESEALLRLNDGGYSADIGAIGV